MMVIINSNEITNQGGTIKFRASNMNLAQIISNDGEEIIHNGTILQKANLTENDIKFKISFDVIIKLESGIYFKGKVSLDLPAQEIIEKGTSTIEINNFENIIFKRNS